MVELVFSPHWFYGKDIAIDLISIFVLLLISFFSIRYYKIKKNKNYLYLALSFFLLALSFIFKILMNFSVYYKVVEVKDLDFLFFNTQTLQYSYILLFVAFLLYRLLTLFGFYTLFAMHQTQSKSSLIFAIYLIVISTYFSWSEYYVLHITSLILLMLIIYHYLKEHLAKEYFTTRLFLYSLVAIAISQLLFIFIKFNNQFYVIAEGIQLLAYIVLLIDFIMVIKHGRKKNKG